MSSQPATDHFALLIGVDCYMPNKLPDGKYWKSLAGCVRDVTHVEAFLKERVGVPAEHILKLTATNVGDKQPAEPPEQWPTYENMVEAFGRIAEMTSPGDHVYIHYSGHGGRASTAYPQLKGEAGTDETLVPPDIGRPDARYLRDVELAGLISRLVERELIVAVVLDSCHSGGMTRGASDATIRGLDTIDTTPRPLDSLVGSAEELTKQWGDLSAATRGVKLGSGWLPEPKGYVLLAACRPSESAFEYPFDGQEKNGALTYWLLDALQEMGPGLSYKVVHDRIIARVHSQFANQTPQLQGEGDRVVFGADRVRPVYAVPVIEVGADGKRLRLNAGQAHGLRKGAEFAVYPHGTTDLTDAYARQALVELTEVGATDSWGTVTDELVAGPIEQGAQAVLVGKAAVQLVRRVCLVRTDDLDSAVDQDAALDAVEEALGDGGWVEVVVDDQNMDYQVAVNEAGEFEIWDPAGQVLRGIPAVPVAAPGAALAVAGRLNHLARYHAVSRLDNPDNLSPLARQLTVELVGKRADYDPADPYEPETVESPGHTLTLAPGEWTALRITNNFSKPLNVTVLDLEPNWAATQIFPSGAGDNFVAFDPGECRDIPLRAQLSGSESEGTDVLKVFATLGTTSYRWLELPPLDKPATRSGTRGVPQNPLEELLSAFAAERPQTRSVRPAAYPTAEWTTAQVELRVSEE